MAKFFKFSDRFFVVQFFEDDPVKITMKISDETDAKILAAGEAFTEADREKDVKKRYKKYIAALVSVIGEDATDSILTRSEDRDCFAVLSVYRYVLSAYAEQKVKNLSAGAH